MKRYKAQCRKAAAWDRRVGVAELRKQMKRGLDMDWNLGFKLGRTKPTTPAGVGAMLEYIEQQSRDTDLSGWYLEGVLTAVKVLKAMEKPEAMR
jgi:hypothetical protein